VALVVALLVFALCAALLVAMQREFDLYYQRSANVLLGEQAHAYLLGAEALAALALKRDADADAQREAPRDDLREFWAQPSAPYALDEGGWLRGELTDLQGRFNLNSLHGQLREGEEGARRYTPEQRFFIRLLRALEVDPQEAAGLAEAIADWIDADSERRPLGAETDRYAVQTPAYRAADAPMGSASELLAVAGVGAELYARLRPLVTAWPRQPLAMNIHTMPVTLLQGLGADDSLEPLPRSVAEGLALEREELGFADLADLLARPALANQSTGDLAALLGESSSWFLLAARVEIAGRETQRYSVLHREGREVRTVLRAAGPL
jgi:general secretion pathway protein K